MLNIHRSSIREQTNPCDWGASGGRKPNIESYQILRYLLWLKKSFTSNWWELGEYISEAYFCYCYSRRQDNGLRKTFGSELKHDSYVLGLTIDFPYFRIPILGELVFLLLFFSSIAIMYLLLQSAKWDISIVP